MLAGVSCDADDGAEEGCLRFLLLSLCLELCLGVCLPFSVKDLAVIVLRFDVVLDCVLCESLFLRYGSLIWQWQSPTSRKMMVGDFVYRHIFDLTIFLQVSQYLTILSYLSRILLLTTPPPCVMASDLRAEHLH